MSIPNVQKNGVFYIKEWENTQLSTGLTSLLTYLLIGQVFYVNCMDSFLLSIWSIYQ